VQTSWLLPDALDRERMLDMDRRIRPVRRAAFGVLAFALLLCGPWLGWWTIAPLVLAALLFRLAEARIDSARRPEFGLFAAWAASQVIIALSVALTGGPDAVTLSWFVLPLVTLGSRFSERGILAGIWFTVVLVVAVSFGVDAQAVISDPPKLIAPLALMVAATMLVTVLMRSDVDTRAEAVIDPLTGMLNRKALAARVSELRQQSEIAPFPVGVIVGDLDHFKQVNDTHGHIVGDAVLRDVAYELRKALRAFDAVYRLGGEEFLVLVPGADVETSVEIAERLRSAIGEQVTQGLQVTMSFGVSATASGAPFDYDEHFARADAALYRAKAAGRDCVRVAAGDAVAV
jgi:diguanylate cyclase (GGDEF)-like protein